jgi:hypothetical protein
VSDKNDYRADRRPKAEEAFLHHDARLCVKSAKRLSHHENGGSVGQRTRYRHVLLHASWLHVSVLNFALLNDLLPNPKDVGKAMGFLVVGGNAFGLLAPIVTGYVISISGMLAAAHRGNETPVAKGSASIAPIRRPRDGRWYR